MIFSLAIKFYSSLNWVTPSQLYLHLLIGSEKAMAPHSSTLAWKIPWLEEPGRLQSIGSLRVGHDWGTSLSVFTFMQWRRKLQPTPVFLPGESQDGGAWWAAVYEVAQSRTRLKRLSSSSSIHMSPPSWTSLPSPSPLKLILKAIPSYYPTYVILLLIKII